MATTPTTTQISRFQVAGMTCDHCARAVTRELSGIPAVETVTVDVPAGEVTVGHLQDLDRSAVAAAIDEAGYQLTD